MSEFKLQEDNTSSATIVLNGVVEYVQALQRLKNLEENTAQDQQELLNNYLSLKKNLTAAVSESKFGYLFEDSLEKVLNSFDSTIQDKLKNSPAILLLSSRIIEVVKNTIDAFIEKHVNAATKINNISTPFLNIKASATDNEVTVTLSDNVSGFPVEILQQLKGKASQLLYASRGREDRNQHKQKNPLAPFLFGGQGLGLQQLIKTMLTGRVEDEKKYSAHAEESYKATLSFTNNEAGGACITITTPIEPLQEVIYNPTNLARFSPVGLNHGGLSLNIDTELDDIYSADFYSFSPPSSSSHLASTSVETMTTKASDGSSVSANGSEVTIKWPESNSSSPSSFFGSSGIPVVF